MSRPTLTPALRAAPLALTLALAACASSPLATYDLTAPRSGISGRAGGPQIVVTTPTATAPLDGERIVVRAPGEGVSLLKGAQWSDKLPDLVQSRLIQTFENGRLLRAVGRPGDRIVADYSLVSEIRRFDIDVASQEAVVEISVKLVGDRSGRIASARVFQARTPGSAANGAAASQALDAALDRVMRDIVAWASAAR
ncbi:MAG TPA: ABC-type transport auxiliary lipoprotein family protein [Beijerinckiaceae bacterium]|jgi:cholesterol transport system auxiliary component